MPKAVLSAPVRCRVGCVFGIQGLGALNLRNKRGFAPLHCAAAVNNWAMAEALLEAGAGPRRIHVLMLAFAEPTFGGSDTHC